VSNTSFQQSLSTSLLFRTFFDTLQPLAFHRYTLHLLETRSSVFVVLLLITDQLLLQTFNNAGTKGDRLAERPRPRF
jgi:hypothetical protein